MNKGKRIWCFLFLTIVIISSIACSTDAVSIDYADAEAFEDALNAGENLEGKVVQFVAKELHPDSAFGYNIWAGEHLNFIASGNPDVEAGDSIVVKAVTIEGFLGSWVIKCEKIDHVVMSDTAISSQTTSQDTYTDTTTLSGESFESTETPAFIDMTDAETESSQPNDSSSESRGMEVFEQPLELTDYGWYINDPTGGTAYIHFCGMIHNPNESLTAEFPAIVVTIKEGDGSICGTETQMGGAVMPGDTITLCGMVSVPASSLADDTDILFDIEWKDFVSNASLFDGAKTTDFMITNVTEKSGGTKNFITGEITNNYSKDMDSIYLALVLRKDGEIVYMENTFIDNLKSGKTKAFEFSRLLSEWPEHDTIEISAMEW